MKRLILIGLMLSLVALPVQAKTVKEALVNTTIEQKAQAVEDGAIDIAYAIASSPYHITKTTLKILASPFYWMEKVAK